MHQGDRPAIPPRVLSTADEPRASYRCGKPEPRPQAFRLLPGSQHSSVCPACYEFLWGWKERLPKTPPEQPPQGGAL